MGTREGRPYGPMQACHNAAMQGHPNRGARTISKEAY